MNEYWRRELHRNSKFYKSVSFYLIKHQPKSGHSWLRKWSHVSERQLLYVHELLIYFLKYISSYMYVIGSLNCDYQLTSFKEVYIYLLMNSTKLCLHFKILFLEKKNQNNNRSSLYTTFRYFVAMDKSHTFIDIVSRLPYIHCTCTCETYPSQCIGAHAYRLS